MKAKDLHRPDPGASAEQALLEVLRAGYRDRDVKRVLSAYADDVECTIVNRNHPPARPLKLRGREALKGMVDDLCAREMTHEISSAVVGKGSLAYRMQCRYPDGCNVVGLYMATVKDGRIVSEFSVDCWDE